MNKSKRSGSKASAAGLRTQRQQKASRSTRTFPHYSNAVSAPAASSSIYTTPLRTAATVVKHCEYVQDLTTSGTIGGFTNIQMKFNPGNSTLFPWLSQIAQGYEEYIVLHCDLVFRSVSSSGTQGLIMLNAQYDSYDASFSNKQGIQDYAGTKSTQVWRDLRFPLDVNVMHKQKQTYYVLPAGDTVSGDERMYYPCNVNFASSNLSAATQNIGEVFIDYSIQFLKPLIGANRMPDVSEIEISTFGFNPVPSVKLFGGSAIQNFSTAPTLEYGNSGFATLDGLTFRQDAQSFKAMPYWAISALFGGAASSAPTFTSTIPATLPVGAIVHDIATDPVPAFDATSGLFTGIRSLLVDLSACTDLRFLKDSPFALFTSPSFSGAVTAASGVAAVLATRISKKMFDSYVIPDAELPRLFDFHHAKLSRTVARHLIGPLLFSVPTLKRERFCSLESKYPRSDVDRELKASTLLDARESDFELKNLKTPDLLRQDRWIRIEEPSTPSSTPKAKAVAAAVERANFSREPSSLQYGGARVQARPAMLAGQLVSWDQTLKDLSYLKEVESIPNWNFVKPRAVQRRTILGLLSA